MTAHEFSAQEAFKLNALEDITNAVRQHATTAEYCWIAEMVDSSKVVVVLGAEPLEIAAAFIKGLQPSADNVVESTGAKG
jgi:hypothetical protein